MTETTKGACIGVNILKMGNAGSVKSIRLSVHVLYYY